MPTLEAPRPGDDENDRQGLAADDAAGTLDEGHEVDLDAWQEQLRAGLAGEIPMDEIMRVDGATGDVAFNVPVVDQAAAAADEGDDEEFGRFV